MERGADHQLLRPVTVQVAGCQGVAEPVESRFTSNRRDACPIASTFEDRDAAAQGDVITATMEGTDGKIALAVSIDVTNVAKAKPKLSPPERTSFGSAEKPLVVP